VAAAIPLEKRYTVDEDTGCWLWVGKRTADGRGEFMRNGRRYYGYRVFYEMANGPIPEGLVIDHREIILPRGVRGLDPEPIDASSVGTHVLIDNRTDLPDGHD
jgi:hypothetical protein